MESARTVLPSTQPVPLTIVTVCFHPRVSGPQPLTAYLWPTFRNAGPQRRRYHATKGFHPYPRYAISSTPDPLAPVMRMRGALLCCQLYRFPDAPIVPSIPNANGQDVTAADLHCITQRNLKTLVLSHRALIEFANLLAVHIGPGRFIDSAE